MPTTVNLRKLLHRKAWETCTAAPANTAAGAFVCSDKFDLNNGSRAFYMTSLTSVWLYDGDEDAWVALPPSGAAGTFAAGACGEYRALGAMGGVFTQAAAGGSTTTIETSRRIVRSLAGCRVRVVAGAGMGYEGTVVSNTLGDAAVVTVAPASEVAFDATTQYQIYSGSLWVATSGTTSVGFSVYDVATNAWTARSVAGLPGAWGTCGQLVSTMGGAKRFATGQSTGGNGPTTLVNTGKAWGQDMWANYQVRIVGGTGRGQIRTIAANSASELSVTPDWTVTPDATSTYSIEGNDDYFYRLGGNAVTIYRYSVSANAWTTLAPAVARAGAMAGGGTADWIDSVPGWDNETLVPHYGGQLFKQNGRYIYSFRGGASSHLDVYDIAGNTWISAIEYGAKQETFTAGSSSCDINGAIMISKENTGRIFRFDVDRNRLTPLATNTLQVALGGNAVEGDKMFVLPYRDGDTEILFGYMLRHSGADLVRMLVF